MTSLKNRLLPKWLKRDPALDEKTFIIEKEKKAKFTDNGSIAKEHAIVPDSKMAENKGKSDHFENGNKDGGSDKMSLSRKISFFFSINVGVFYVVFFAVILPCRNPFCENFQKMWESNCSNGSLVSNFAIRNLPEQLLIFANVSESIGRWNLQAMSMRDSSRIWNISLNFNPEIVFCGWKESSFDANFDEVNDCIVIGHDDLIIINATDGHILWRKTLHEFGSLKQIAVIEDNNSTSYSKALELVFLENRTTKATNKIHLLVLNGSTGEILKRIDVPCTGNEELTFMDRMAPNLNGTGVPEWILVCASQNSTET